MKIRFTTWLSEPERDGIRKLAEENHISENSVIRDAVRSYLGLSSRMLHVTTDTTTTEREHHV